MKKRIELLTGVFTLFTVIVWLPVLAACSNAENNLPMERVSLSKHACLDGYGLTPHIPLGVNHQIKAPALAGGIVRSGDFLISLYLICDPSLASDDPESPMYSWQDYSEVRYLGLLNGWVYYRHPPTEKETEMSLTINGVVNREEMIVSHNFPKRHLSWGIGSSYYGPIMTENQIIARSLSAGEPIEIVMKISDSKTIAAVRLLATFEEASDGYRLLSAEIMEGKINQ